MMTIDEIRQYAKEFLMNEYGLILTVPIKLNGRLKASQGRFISSRSLETGEKKAEIIELNKTLVMVNSREMVLDILKHELVHYALFMKGLPFHDGHPTFEKELNRLGIMSQARMDEKDREKLIVKVQIYKCIQCENEIIRKVRLRGNLRKYSCPCGGKLIDCGKVLKAI